MKIYLFSKQFRKQIYSGKGKYIEYTDLGHNAYTDSHIILWMIDKNGYMKTHDIGDSDTIHADVFGIDHMRSKAFGRFDKKRNDISATSSNYNNPNTVEDSEKEWVEKLLREKFGDVTIYWF